MSQLPAFEPVCEEVDERAALEMVIDGRTRDLGGLTVRRLLPSRLRRNVGPFVFLDEMGPVTLEAGQGLDVGPHPHIGLATVTYLLEGEVLHRDSLGTEQLIEPGAVNWMTAGRGVVHSERTDPRARARQSRLHGLQLWVALPEGSEDIEPAFIHLGSEDLPVVRSGNSWMRVVCGRLHGTASPLRVPVDALLVDVWLSAGDEISPPDGGDEQAVYLIEGELDIGHERLRAGQLGILGRPEPIRARREARFAIVGGSALDAPRHIWWNFVSSDRERIEQAKRDWAEDRFPRVPGDEDERIPLPE